MAHRAEGGKVYPASTWRTVPVPPACGTAPRTSMPTHPHPGRPARPGTRRLAEPGSPGVTGRLSPVDGLRGFVRQVRDDADVRVIVFQSADDEFFSAHGDMNYLTDPDALPTATRAAIAVAPDTPIPDGLNILQAMCVEMRALRQVTIGKIAGFARGAGNEFLMSLDMRFAAIGRSGQPVSQAAESAKRGICQWRSGVAGDADVPPGTDSTGLNDQYGVPFRIGERSDLGELPPQVGPCCRHRAYGSHRIYLPP
jgi:hypothetical protein